MVIARDKRSFSLVDTVHETDHRTIPVGPIFVHFNILFLNKKSWAVHSPRNGVLVGRGADRSCSKALYGAPEP